MQWITPARRATTNTGRRCTTEAAGLGPTDARRPLAACRADHFQLVVGPPPPYRLAHLVGHRDPDAAALSAHVGLRRKLDGALVELHPRPAGGNELSQGEMDRNRPHAP